MQPSDFVYTRQELLPPLQSERNLAFNLQAAIVDQVVYAVSLTRIDFSIQIGRQMVVDSQKE